MKKINHWINGKNVAGNDYFQTTNPATGDVLAEVASGGEAEVNQAVAAAKEAFPKWANLPMKERARLMRRLGDLIDQHVPEIAAMETADTGLPIHQTKNVLIPRASHNFEFFAEVCQQMNGKTYPVDDKMLNYTLVQPVGVCALVSPWNVPFMTATWKVAPCLALGNTAVLKMSELSPLTADRLGELALEAGIPAGVLNVVQGYGATAGDALVRHHDVRAVSFTGGTATGRNIMKNAGLKKYSMELGGKSPVLIFEDADIERALDAALFTIFSIIGDLDIDPFTLYGICIFNSDVGIIQRHCANLFTLFFSLIKSLGDQGMGLFIEHSCFLLRHSVLLRRVATRVRLTRPTVRYCFVHRFF